MANIKSHRNDHPGAMTELIKTPAQKRNYRTAAMNTKTVGTTKVSRDVVAPPPHEFMVGPFKVTMQNKQHYRLYSIRLPSDGTIIGKQASYPSIHDCLDGLDRARGAGTVSWQEYKSLSSQSRRGY